MREVGQGSQRLVQPTGSWWTQTHDKYTHHPVYNTSLQPPLHHNPLLNSLKMNTTTELIPPTIQTNDEEEEACMFAMQLASASVLPMVLKSAIELDLLESIAKAGPGAYVAPAELAAKLPSSQPETPVKLDRILRLLASYSVLKCKLRELPQGGVERLYALAPVCKFLTKNSDGVSMAPLLLMNQDKILMESW